MLVAASLVLVAISVRVGADEALPVDVRRTAQIQQEDLRADRAAIDLGLRGTLAIDARTGAVEVRLAPLPDSTATLALTLIHPSRAAQDRRLTLTRSGDRFLGRVPLPLPAAWTVQVAAADGAWRVAGRFERGRIEGLAGVNLPMLLRAINYREKGMETLLLRARDGGRDGVFNMLDH